jgi:hypothetical protein
MKRKTSTSYRVTFPREATRDATGFAVKNVMFRKQVVFVRLKMGAIGGGGLARAPLLWQLELGIQVDQIRRGSAQVFNIDMATIGKCNLIR